MTTRTGTRAFRPLLGILAGLALGLPLGCDGGGEGVDRATVTIQEPGVTILDDTPQADAEAPAAPPVEEAPAQP